MSKEYFNLSNDIIKNYLIQEKMGWHHEHLATFGKLVDSIRERNSDKKLKTIIEEHVIKNQCDYKSWKNSLYVGENHLKPYLDKKKLIELLLFFNVCDEIELTLTLSDFSYGPLYIFDVEEWSAKVALKLKDQYRDKTVYMLYRDILNDELIQTALSNRVIDYNRELCLTSQAMPDFEKISSLSDAREFVFRYSQEFGRVRASRYAVIKKICQGNFQINEIKHDIDEKVVMESGLVEIGELLTKKMPFTRLFSLNATVTAEIVFNLICAQIQKDLQDYTDDETIFDYVIRKGFPHESPIYALCCNYCKMSTNHYDLYDNLMELTEDFKKKNSERCLKMLKREVANGKGKHTQNNLPKLYAMKTLLKECNLIEDDQIAGIGELNEFVEGQDHLLDTKNFGKLLDVINEIKTERSLSRQVFLLVLMSSVSTKSLEKCVLDPNNIDNRKVAQKIQKEINGLLTFCGFAQLNKNNGQMDYLLLSAIENVNYELIYKSDKKKIIFWVDKNSENVPEYPLIEYISELLRTVREGKKAGERTNSIVNTFNN